LSYFSQIALQLQKHLVELCLLTRPWLKSIQSVPIVVSITGAEGFPIATCSLRVTSSIRDADGREPIVAEQGQKSKVQQKTDERFCGCR
jgi:hypothetical protein